MLTKESRRRVRIPYSDRKQKRADVCLLMTVIEAEEGGGHLPVLIMIEEASKERYSLTRKLVVYRNWRQWWREKC